jgi:hypothetical protein
MTRLTALKALLATRTDIPVTAPIYRYPEPDKKVLALAPRVMVSSHHTDGDTR